MDALIQTGVTEVPADQKRRRRIPSTFPRAGRKRHGPWRAARSLFHAAGGGEYLSTTAAPDAIGNRSCLVSRYQSGGKPVSNFGGDGSAAIAIPTHGARDARLHGLCGRQGRRDLPDRFSWAGTLLHASRPEPGISRSTAWASTNRCAGVHRHQRIIEAKADIDFVTARGLLSTGAASSVPAYRHDPSGCSSGAGQAGRCRPGRITRQQIHRCKADAYCAPMWAAEEHRQQRHRHHLLAPDARRDPSRVAVIMANYAGPLGYNVPKTRRGHRDLCGQRQHRKLGEDAVKSQCRWRGTSTTG